MQEVVSYLEKSSIQYFATIGLDNKPKVRPFQFMFEADRKLWFCTSNQKEVYKELQTNSYVELCVSATKMSWMRISAKVAFTDSVKVKKRIFNKSPLVKGIYKELNNPKFEVFYLEGIIASISEIGKPPVIYT